MEKERMKLLREKIKNIKRKADDFYSPSSEVVGGYTGFTISIRLSVHLGTNPMSYDSLSCVS
jgi:hypothetical protein